MLKTFLERRDFNNKNYMSKENKNLFYSFNQLKKKDDEK